MKVTLKNVATAGLVFLSIGVSFWGVQFPVNAATWCERIGLCVPPPRPRPGIGARPTSGVPEAIVQTAGQPALAVFPERKESFALGCDFSNLWRGLSVEQVSSTVYSATKAAAPVVADINCDGRVQAYAPQGEPAALVISYRDGVSRRHYINNTEFVRVITGSDRLIPISRQDFARRFPQRGTDFRRW
ncbi:hypothetical protein QUA62_24000 [Microcoleus sp. MON1_C1]|uniref:hypothetical protein n=1 Tax=Microcoleus sp. MON1_C1 TaxID=2818827 RepID=UPI002FCF3E09